MGFNSRAASSTILGLSKCWLHLKTRARSESRRTYFMGTYKTKKRAQNILPSLCSLLMISKQGSRQVRCSCTPRRSTSILFSSGKSFDTLLRATHITLPCEHKYIQLRAFISRLVLYWVLEGVFGLQVRWAHRWFG